MKPKVFPPGSMVYLDGRYVATVLRAFPDGSTGYLFPYYKIRVDGDTDAIVVQMGRVGVRRY